MSRPVWKLHVGEEAPAFKLPATGPRAGHGDQSSEVALADFRGRKNVLLAFYPAAFTPV